MNGSKSIAIACDHAGFKLKTELISYLESKKENDKKIWDVDDLGTYDEKPVDYPDFGIKVVRKVHHQECKTGILVCGNGIGMSIVANRFHGIRAAVCVNSYMARMAREHNKANILVFGGRVVGVDLAKQILDTWLNTSFSEDERHKRRLKKIERLKI